MSSEHGHDDVDQITTLRADLMESQLPRGLIVAFVRDHLVGITVVSTKHALVGARFSQRPHVMIALTTLHVQRAQKTVGPELDRAATFCTAGCWTRPDDCTSSSPSSAKRPRAEQEYKPVRAA